MYIADIISEQFSRVFLQFCTLDILSGLDVHSLSDSPRSLLSYADLIALVHPEITPTPSLPPSHYPELIRVPSTAPSTPFSVSYSVSGFQRFQKLHPDPDPWHPRHLVAARVAPELVPGVGVMPLSPGLSLPISARGRISWAFWRAISSRWWVSLISQRLSIRYTRCPRTMALIG